MNDTTQLIFFDEELTSEEGDSSTDPSDSSVFDYDAADAKSFESTVGSVNLKGRYVNIQRIGGGKYDAVYEASLKSIKQSRRQPVVLRVYKIPKGKKADRNALVAAYTEKYKALGSQYLPEKIEEFQIGANYVLSQVRIKGSNLREYLQGDDISFVEFYSIFKNIAQGLDALHEQQLLHLDLKPTNIVIRNTDKRPFFIDFGVSVRPAGSNKRLLLSTRFFTAPQVWNGQAKPSLFADYYSFGVTLSESLLSFSNRPIDRSKLFGWVIPAIHDIDQRNPCASLFRVAYQCVSESKNNALSGQKLMNLFDESAYDSWEDISVRTAVNRVLTNACLPKDVVVSKPTRELAEAFGTDVAGATTLPARRFSFLLRFPYSLFDPVTNLPERLIPISFFLAGLVLWLCGVILDKPGGFSLMVMLVACAVLTEIGRGIASLYLFGKWSKSIMKEFKQSLDC